jgi:predicted GIY-YIG superfamily endonuclease
MSRRNGTVYTIHFAKPIGPSDRGPKNQARHYTGWAANLESRLQAHSEGRGSHLMAAVKRAGIEWVVAATQPGTRARERQLKQHSATRRCPECQKEKVMEKITVRDLMKGVADGVYTREQAVEATQAYLREGKVIHQLAEVDRPVPENGDRVKQAADNLARAHEATRAERGRFMEMPETAGLSAMENAEVDESVARTEYCKALDEAEKAADVELEL